MAPQRARPLIHAAGAAWLAACAAVAWQTAQGRPMLELSPANGVAAVSLLTWAAVAAFAARTWLRGGTGAAPRVLPATA